MSDSPGGESRSSMRTDRWEDLPPTMINNKIRVDEVPTVPRAGAGAATETDLGLADYRISGLIRRGGMGVVYLAQDLKLGRPVALKMILGGQCAGTNLLMRFRTEAEAIAR